MPQRQCMTERSDTELVEETLQGDHMSFEVLVSRYHPLLYAYLRKQTHNHEQAEDLVQTVWLQFYLSLPQLSSQRASPRRDVTSLRPWLFRVAANRFIDECRRRHPLCFSVVEATGAQDEPLEEQLIDPAPLPEAVGEQHDLQATVRIAIDALPVRFRDIVFLRSVEALPFQEIASRLHMPEATVKTYFHRARPLLRNALIPFVASNRASKSSALGEQEW